MSRVAQPLTVSGALTVQDPRGNEHRLTALGSSLVLDLHGLLSLRELARVVPGRSVRARALSTLHRGLEQADVTLYVRLWGRTAARLSPGDRKGLLGRLLGLPGLRVMPMAFLLHRGLPAPG